MVSERVKWVGAGSIVTFFVGLGPAIPAVGIFTGPLFTFGGGFLGGAVASGLSDGAEREGMKLGLAVAFIGGLSSAMVAIPLGTFLNMQVVDTITQSWVWVVYAAVGLFVGMFLTFLGGAIGGGLVGYLTKSSS
jgi:hypothetical protein